MPLIRAEFEKQPTAHWVAQLTEADVMNAKVQTYGDFMADEHTRSSTPSLISTMRARAQCRCRTYRACRKSTAHRR